MHWVSGADLKRGCNPSFVFIHANTQYSNVAIIIASCYITIFVVSCGFSPPALDSLVLGIYPIGQFSSAYQNTKYFNVY